MCSLHALRHKASADLLLRFLGYCALTIQHKLQTARFSSPEELQTPSLEDQKQSSWSRFWDGLGVDLDGVGLVWGWFWGGSGGFWVSPLIRGFD